MYANQSMEQKICFVVGREEEEEREWATETCQTELTKNIKKSQSFASLHKSLNHMWYLLQKVPLEKDCIWYKEAEIGAILHMVCKQVPVFDEWVGVGGLCLCDTYSEFLRKVWALGLPEPLQSFKVSRP